MEVCLRQNGVGVSMLAWYHHGRGFDPCTEKLFIFIFGSRVFEIHIQAVVQNIFWI